MSDDSATNEKAERLQAIVWSPELAAGRSRQAYETMQAIAASMDDWYTSHGHGD
jgi:uncharacterized heparinase superfamily protein